MSEEMLEVIWQIKRSNINTEYIFKAILLGIAAFAVLMAVEWSEEFNELCRHHKVVESFLNQK